MNIPKEFTRKLALKGVDQRIIKTAYKIYNVLLSCDVKKEKISKNALKRMAGLGAGNNQGLDNAIMAMLNAEIINDKWEVIWRN